MTESKKVRTRRPRQPLTASSLENAALLYLGRYASSAGNLRRVLMRKVARAARGEAEEEAHALGVRMVDALIARYLASGLLDDRAYAAQKAASLARRGASRFVIGRKLAQQNVDPEFVAGAIAALEEAGAGERAAACALVRRRRLGPYRPTGERAEWRQRDLASLARAGFGLELARQVLGAPDVEAIERMARGEDEG